MALKKESEYKFGPLPIDESWWTAVLEEAEAQYTTTPRSVLNNPQQQNASQAYIEETTTKRKTETASEENVVSHEIDWQWVKQLYDQDLVINLDVTDHNRGGLLVYGDNIQGFVPASHLIGLSKNALKKDREDLLSPYVGRILQLKVIECDQDRGRIVFSERAAQTDPGKRLELLNRLEVGDQRIGWVTTITDFGVFVDLGGVEGLIHISELSWGRVCHPNDIVSIGDQVEVHILQIERDRARVALSLKRLHPNPWESIHDHYSPGQIVNAVITNIVSFGAFARLEDGLDGLIHISEFGDQVDAKSIEDNLTEGQAVQVCIIHIDPERQRLGLSLSPDDDAVK
ncbi:MAG: S1 RNA-binding domain-containing protein [Anaerolineales bacterium]|nr:S1 RNA-binding domain-containing protein [Anaerolineales bacterium]